MGVFARRTLTRVTLGVSEGAGDELVSVGLSGQRADNDELGPQRLAGDQFCKEESDMSAVERDLGVAKNRNDRGNNSNQRGHDR